MDLISKQSETYIFGFETIQKRVPFGTQKFSNFLFQAWSMDSYLLYEQNESKIE